MHYICSWGWSRRFPGALSFQQALVQGLLALPGALIGYFFWALCWRVVLEDLAAVFRMAEAIALERTETQQFSQSR